jgi:hypothetical protein
MDGAIAAWKRAVELSPTQFDAMLNLARALEDRSRPEAISYLERFVREAPEARYRGDIQKAPCPTSGMARRNPIIRSRDPKNGMFHSFQRSPWFPLAATDAESIVYRILPK